jgi:hypothetical protein
MSDPFIRSGVSQLTAFVAGVILLNLLVLLDPASGRTLGGAMVVSVYTGAFLLPFLLIDLFVLRPILANRVGLPILFLAEFVVALLNQAALHWQGIAVASGRDLGVIAVRAVLETAVFLVIYTGVGILLANVMPSHPAGSTNGP